MPGPSCKGEVINKNSGAPRAEFCSPHTTGKRSMFDIKGPDGLAGLVHEKLQFIQDFLAYRNAKKGAGDCREEFHSLFRRFVAATFGQRCLRLVFDDDGTSDLGSNWVTVDLKDLQRRSIGGGELTIDLEDGYFDAVLCTGLDRISHPKQLISEVKRLLVPCGQVWAQVPLCGPYVCAPEPEQVEYWRMTPEGLKILFEDFDEILCSLYLPRGNALRSFSFYYGLKYQDELQLVVSDECENLMPG